ncbi:MAG: serine/threonine-protein kinase [Planctomycetota bacterium]
MEVSVITPQPVDPEPVEPSAAASARVDWEGFYRSYRKPGYLAGFEILNKLGGGMFGLVFKARKASIGKDYAVKFLKVDDDTVRDAVMREIENVGYFAQIDHPNLVSIEDKGVVDGIPYLVMSYAGDETLQKRLRGEPLDRAAALHIFTQAARGVQALHEHSLVHFDLKPANIFLKGDVARVGDYGLSKLVSASRNSLSFGRGTPYYMAPELLQRRGDARSDVYSLGVILYECLYGDVPFRGDSEWEVLRKHEQQEVAFPASARPEDEACIRRCLQKDPDARFQTAADLVRAIAGGGLPAAATAEAAASHAATSGAAPSASGAPESAAPPPLPAAAARPRGMPWQTRAPRPSAGPFEAVARVVVAAADLATQVLLLPARVVATALGPGLRWTLQLPVRLFGAFAQLVGLVVVAAIVLLVVVTLMALLAPGV